MRVDTRLRKRCAAYFVVLGVVCGQRAWADEDFAEKTAHGMINWTQHTLTVTGSGAPNLKAVSVAVARVGAERGAKDDAQRRALEAIRDLHVDSKTTVADLLVDNAIKARLEGILRDVEVLDTRYYADGGVDVVVRVTLVGPLLDVLTGQKQTVVPQPAGEAQKRTPEQESTADDEGAEIIVVAKGLGLRPALVPRIFSEEGREIVGPAGRQPTAAHGFATYTTSLEAAKKLSRVTDKPLIIKALRLAPSGGCDLVVTDAAAALLTEASTTFARRPLAIVIDASE